MFNQNLQNNLRAMQEKQQEDKQWKEDVLSVLISINEKLDKLVITEQKALDLDDEQENGMTLTEITDYIFLMQKKLGTSYLESMKILINAIELGKSFDLEGK